MVGLDPTQKKSGPGLGLKPSRPNLCLLRVCLANNVWAFGLKNVRAIYQRAMTIVFYYMTHQKVEVHMDDILSKSKKEKDHVQV